MKCTSKASYLELKESGAELSQAGKILGIIKTGQSMSLQEILKAYRSQYGLIELSSVSGRVNGLKKDGQIEEGLPRKCSISHRSINPLRVKGACRHECYNNDNYEFNGKTGAVWRGKLITHCKDCGADISHFNFVPVKTKAGYMRGLACG